MLRVLVQNFGSLESTWRSLSLRQLRSRKVRKRFAQNLQRGGSRTQIFWFLGHCPSLHQLLPCINASSAISTPTTADSLQTREKQLF